MGLGTNHEAMFLRRGILLVRSGVAALLFIHGVARVFAGGVSPFGEFLASWGLPFGHAIAWAITIAEIVGTPLLAFGLVVAPLCLYFMAQLAFGIAMVHAQYGWFVVGLGRNGVEYSVLLEVCLLAILIAHRSSTVAAHSTDESPG